MQDYARFALQRTHIAISRPDRFGLGSSIINRDFNPDKRRCLGQTPLTSRCHAICLI